MVGKLFTPQYRLEIEDVFSTVRELDVVNPERLDKSIEISPLVSNPTEFVEATELLISIGVSGGKLTQKFAVGKTAVTVRAPPVAYFARNSTVFEHAIPYFAVM